MTLYSISGWQKHFEVYDAKRVDGPLKWVAVPTKTDGFGFSRIKLERDCCQLLAAWYLMLGVAAKQEKKDRGKLQRDGIPLTADDLELITGFPAKVFERAFSFYTQQRQGWLLAEEVPIDVASMQHQPAPRAPTGQDSTRHNMTVGQSAGVPAPTSNVNNSDDAEWLAALRSNPAYAGLNVGEEYGKMQAWCGANRKQPNRRRFVNWLNRCDKPMPRTLTMGATAKPVDGPTGWRSLLIRLRPGNTFEGGWSTLPQSMRDEIEAAARQQQPATPPPGGTTTHPPHTP